MTNVRRNRCTFVIIILRKDDKEMSYDEERLNNDEANVILGCLFYLEDCMLDKRIWKIDDKDYKRYEESLQKLIKYVVDNDLRLK